MVWFNASKWHWRFIFGRALFLLIPVNLILDFSMSKTPRSAPGLGSVAPVKTL